MERTKPVKKMLAALSVLLLLLFCTACSQQAQTETGDIVSMTSSSARTATRIGPDAVRQHAVRRWKRPSAGKWYDLGENPVTRSRSSTSSYIDAAGRTVQAFRTEPDEPRGRAVHRGGRPVRDHVQFR
jgi:hypothetical protein